MAEDRHPSGQVPPRDGKSLSFLSTFSSRGEYERISEDGDGAYQLADIAAADISRSTSTASRHVGASNMNEPVSPVENESPSSGKGSQGRMPTPDLLVTPPASSQPFESQREQEPGALRQPESAPQPAALPRKSKFREMLEKSLSSRKRGRQPSPAYNSASPVSIEQEFAMYDGHGESGMHSNDPTDADLSDLYGMISLEPSASHDRKLTRRPQPSHLDIAIQGKMSSSVTGHGSL